MGQQTGNLTVQYLIEHHEEVKELANTCASFIMALGLLVIIAAFGYFGTKLMRENKKVTTEALNGVKDAVSALKDVVLTLNNEVSTLNKSVEENTELLMTQSNIILPHDERSRSIKEICCDTNDKVDAIHRDMPSKSDIVAFGSKISDVATAMAVAVSHMPKG